MGGRLVRPLVCVGVTLALAISGSTAAPSASAYVSATSDVAVSLSNRGSSSRYVDMYASAGYVMTVSNSGPDTATDVHAAFEIGIPGAVDLDGRPAPIERFTGVPQPVQGTCTGSAFLGYLKPTRVDCSLGSIPGGGSVELPFEVTAGRWPPLTPGVSEDMTNHASVSSGSTDAVPENNTTSETTPIVQGWADVGTSIKQTPANPSRAGEPITYTVQARNDGPDSPSSLLAFSYPSSDDLVSQPSSPCDHQDVNGAIAVHRCFLGVPSGTTKQFTFTVIPRAPGTHTVTAGFQSACWGLDTRGGITPDPILGDETASVSAHLDVAETDLRIEGSPSQPKIGLNRGRGLHIHNHE